MILKLAITYLYNTMGWNYVMTALTIILLFTNISLLVGFLVVYVLTPTHIRDLAWLEIVKFGRSLYSDTFDQIEENIRKTFLIHVLHPIPEKSIRIWHPHGLNASAAAIHNVYRLTDFKQNDSKTVVHWIFHMLPIVSDSIRNLNCVSSNYSTIKNTLDDHSITIQLGGLEEMRRTKHKRMELVIKKRVGIFKIALETGTHIVPVLTYGENEVFPSTENEVLKWFNDKVLYDFARLQYPFPSFKALKNWMNLLVRPLDTIHTYTGKPIHVKKIENPSDHQIASLRRVYIREIRRLFKETNPGDFTLKIV